MFILILLLEVNLMLSQRSVFWLAMADLSLVIISRMTKIERLLRARMLSSMKVFCIMTETVLTLGVQVLKTISLRRQKSP